MSLSAAVVGTGPHPEREESGDGYSMGYRHANGYREVEDCAIVGCADVVPAHAEAFAAEFGLPDGRAYEDYEAMLADLDPDVVSVCTPPATHPEIVAGCVAGGVGAVHCEKPMATTLAESRRMVTDCEDAGVQLTFNIQGRCSETAREAERLIEAGEIGDVDRVEASRRDLLQTGIHNVSLAHHLNGDRAVDWVLGAVDVGERTRWYTDMYAENQGLGLWAYENGVHGLVHTREEESVVGCHNRVRGTRGELELRNWGETPLRIRRDGGDWEAVDVHGSGDAQANAIRDVADAYRSGERSTLDAEYALAATETVFAVWESARRRARVDCPPDVDGNPLAELVDEHD